MIYILRYFFVFFYSITLDTKIHAQELNLETDPNRAEYVTDQFGTIQTHIKPQDVIHWEFIDSLVKTSNQLTVNLRLRTEKNFTIYKDKLEFQVPVGISVKNIQFPLTTKLVDPISKENVEVFTGGEFVLELSGDTFANSTPQSNFELGVHYVGCTRVICLFPFTEKLTIVSTVSAQNPLDNEALANNETITSQLAPAETQSLETKLSAYFTKLLSNKQPLWLVLLVALVGGLLTNFTPCVAPMIPITLRILSKQSKKPFLNASMYALGLMLTYTLLGLIAAYTASLFGSFIAHPLVSLAFSILMLVFGITMVGYGDLSKIQMFGAKIGGGQPRFINTFLMGGAAGFVAAPCTGPILAAILTYTASRQNLNEAFALLAAYSFGFAFPYVFLGAFSQRISRLKISSFWQKSSKILFAALMFALSFYYARVAFYGAFISAKPYLLQVACGSFLIGLIASYYAFLRPHQKKYSLLASVFLGLTVFCLTQADATEKTALMWIDNEKDAFELAQKQHKPILIDSWAEWCEACKKMEKTTFADPEVINFLQAGWILAKIDLTEQNSFSEEFQKRYEIIGLPTLISLPESSENSKKILIAGFVDATELLKRLRLAKEKWQGKP